jgi:aerobic C4-dicarboxylate transport protein
MVASLLAKGARGHEETPGGAMLLTSKGVATFSGGSFVTFPATATGILALEGRRLMFYVYRLMAPATSTCNAVSNAIATVVIGKLCGA